MKDHGERTGGRAGAGGGTGRRLTITDTGIAHWCSESVAYRGYDVRDLVCESTFTEVAYLLLYGELPDELFLADFRAVLAESAEVPRLVTEFLEQLPLHVSASDVLRTAIGAVAHFDPQPGDGSVESDRSRAIRLLAQVPVLVSARYRATRGFGRLEPDPTSSYPATLLSLVTGQPPSPLLEKAVDVMLMTAIDVGLSPAVQAARLAISGGGDLYGAVLGAAAVETTPERGDLACRLVALWQSASWGDDVDGWVRERLNRDGGLPGLVSLLDSAADPRREFLWAWTERLVADTGRHAINAAATAIERAAAKWGWVPRWEWTAIRLLAVAGIEPELHLPLLAVARLLGWSAHALEQATGPAWPSAEPHYVGPPARDFPPHLAWD